MVWSFVYLALRRVLELVLLCFRSAQAKEIEILVLRHELAVPHRSLAHATPVPSERTGARSAPNFGGLRRRDVLGGLIHEYEYAA